MRSTQGGLRIIGGRFKNRALKSPKGEATRPTAAILRKSVFDICQTFIEGTTFLDLYAGTGAMGLEALSRGAAHATFVENDREALRTIEENIRLLNVASECSLVRSDVLAALKRFAAKGASFDLIYVDAPYHLTAPVLDILTLIDQSELLRKEGRLLIEEGTPSHLKPEGLALSKLLLVNSRGFGKSLLHQFRRKE